MGQFPDTSRARPPSGDGTLRGALRAYVRRGGLRAKIIAWFLVPTALILAAVATLVVTASQRVTQELVFERNAERTQLLANQLAVELAAYPQALDTLAAAVSEAPTGLPALLDSGWPVGALEMYDGGALVLGPDGVITAATYGLRDEVGRSLGLPVPVPEAEALGFTDVTPDVLAGMDALFVVSPLAAGAGEAPTAGQLVGVIRAERTATRGSTFYRRIWELYIGRRFSAEMAETAYLVDGNGCVIFHPDTFLIGEDFSDHEAVQQALAGAVGAIRTRDLAGHDVVAGFGPVPRTPWVLVTEETWAEIARTSDPYLRLMVGLLMLGVAAPVVTVALGVRRITRPLETMTQAARDLAGGSFDRRIDVRTGDELETLGDQFNAMAAELRASYATLEQRVADRTQELATLNTIATVVSRSLQLDAIMDAALEVTLSSSGIDAGAAFRLQEGHLDLIAHHGFSPDFVQRVVSLPLDVSVAADAIAAMQPVVRNVTDYPEGSLRHLLEEEGVVTVVCVPLIAKDAVRGVLNLATFGPRSLTPEAHALLAAIGRQTGLAVENACLY